VVDLMHKYKTQSYVTSLGERIWEFRTPHAMLIEYKLKHSFINEPFIVAYQAGQYVKFPPYPLATYQEQCSKIVKCSLYNSTGFTYWLDQAKVVPILQSLAGPCQDLTKLNRIIIGQYFPELFIENTEPIGVSLDNMSRMEKRKYDKIIQNINEIIQNDKLEPNKFFLVIEKENGEYVCI